METFIYICIVGENEEISIKQVANAIVKAIGFEGDYKVRVRCFGRTAMNYLLFCSLILHERMGSIGNLLPMPNFLILLVTSNSRLLSRVGPFLQFNKFALTGVSPYSSGGERLMVRAEL